MRPSFRAASILGLTLMLGAPLPVGGRSAESAFTAVVIVFDASVSHPERVARELGARHDFEVRHVYVAALKGFAAKVPAGAISALRTHPAVRLLQPDIAHEIADQALPSGVDRVELDENSGVSLSGELRVAVPVATLDTGVDRDHPDLNVAGGRNFTGGNPDAWDDLNGHGTHVAGTIGAIGNTSGVVGIAPGTPIYAYKVCRRSCFSSDIAAAIDHVAARKAEANDGATDGDPGIDFAAANMSITSADTTKGCVDGVGATITHTAICGLRETGVVFAMAAGNDARKKDAYPEAFTVAAIADFDGRGGGTSAATCRSDEDDTLANFSNWNVDIAAPGTCILSTWLDGTTHTISGTSMATPHVAGAVALYVHVNGRASSALDASAIEAAIVTDALAPVASNDGTCSYENPGSGERLLYLDGPAFGSALSDCELGSEGDPDQNDPPSASFTYTCPGSLTCEFDASESTDEGSIVTYEWAFGDGTVEMAIAPTTAHTYAKRGNYTVILTVHDDAGASASQSKKVRVR